MTRRMLLSSALTLLCVGFAQAQERPDFTGTWMMDVGRSASAAQASIASLRVPVTLVIAQSPNGLRVETVSDGESVVVHYGFDARPVGTAGSDEAAPEGTSIAWDGDVLETTTSYRINGMAVTKTERRHLAADGQEMTVEFQQKVEHGYEMLNGQKATIVRDVYKRVSPQ